MTTRRAALAVMVVALGALVVALWWRAHWGARAPSPGSDAVPAPGELSVADPTAFAGLHAAGSAPRDDVRIVGAVLRNYLQSVRGEAVPPLGFNEEIVRALRGANPLGVAFIPARHPAIDVQGRLCDRWGTPYLFHPLAAESIEVRSAGPDRRLFTADDLLAESVQE